jgi:hypothetical protein
MARSRQIGGKSQAAQERVRAPIDTRVARTQRTVRLTSDAYDGGRPDGFWRLIARPSALFCVSLLAFVTVAGMQAWEAGLFDRIIGPQGAGPIERGPVRFAPRERAAAKPYVATPDPEPAAKKEKAADSEEPTADDE